MSVCIYVMEIVICNILSYSIRYQVSLFIDFKFKRRLSLDEAQTDPSRDMSHLLTLINLSLSNCLQLSVIQQDTYKAVFSLNTWPRHSSVGRWRIVRDLITSYHSTASSATPYSCQDWCPLCVTACCTSHYWDVVSWWSFTVTLLCLH